MTQNKHKPIWYYLIPKSWRSCIYFANLERECARALGQVVMPIWYYLIEGKVKAMINR